MKAQRAVKQEESRLGEPMEFMRAFWEAEHGIQKASKWMRTALGVTEPQRSVVRVIGRSPRVSAGGIAEILHVHPSTLTGILRRLEEKKVLIREEDPVDARRALFSLTKRGREVDQIRSGTSEMAVRAALAKHVARDIEAAKAVLKSLSAEFERLAERPAKGEGASRGKRARRPAKR